MQSNLASHNKTENWFRKMIVRVTAFNTIPYLLLMLGLTSILFSTFSSSYVLAFIGLGVTFWGALFLYIKPTKYVKLELLNSTSLSTLANIEKMLANAKANSQGIYLPPKRLQDHTSSLVFVPTKPDQSFQQRRKQTRKNLKPKTQQGY